MLSVNINKYYLTFRREETMKENKIKQKTKNLLIRDDPNITVIIFVLLILSLLSIIFAIGLGPVSVKSSNVAKIIFSKL